MLYAKVPPSKRAAAKRRATSAAASRRIAQDNIVHLCRHTASNIVDTMIDAEAGKTSAGRARAAAARAANNATFIPRPRTPASGYYGPAPIGGVGVGGGGNSSYAQENLRALYPELLRRGHGSAAALHLEEASALAAEQAGTMGPSLNFVDAHGNVGVVQPSDVNFADLPPQAATNLSNLVLVQPATVVGTMAGAPTPTGVVLTAGPPAVGSAGTDAGEHETAGAGATVPFSFSRDGTPSARGGAAPSSEKSAPNSSKATTLAEALAAQQKALASRGQMTVPKIQLVVPEEESQGPQPQQAAPGPVLQQPVASSRSTLQPRAPQPAPSTRTVNIDDSVRTAVSASPQDGSYLRPPRSVASKSNAHSSPPTASPSAPGSPTFGRAPDYHTFDHVPPSAGAVQYLDQCLGYHLPADHPHRSRLRLGPPHFYANPLYQVPLRAGVRPQVPVSNRPLDRSQDSRAVRQYVRDKNDLMQEVVDIRWVNEELSRQIALVLRDKYDAAESWKKAAGDAVFHRQKAEAAEHALQVREQELAATQALHSETQRRCDRLEEDNRHLEAKNLEYLQDLRSTERNNDATQRLADLQREKLALEERFASAESERVLLKQQFSQAEDKLHTADRASRNLVEKVRALEKEKTRLQKEALARQDDIEEMEGLYQNKDCTYATQLSSKQAQLDQVVLEFENFKRRLSDYILRSRRVQSSPVVTLRTIEDMCFVEETYPVASTS